MINYDIKILYKNYYIKNILPYFKYNVLLLMLKMPLWVCKGRDVSHDCTTTECFSEDMKVACKTFYCGKK